MPESRLRFESLLKKYISGTCSEEELRELFHFLDKADNKEILFSFMNNKYETIKPAREDEADWEQMLVKIKEQPVQRAALVLWKKIAVAASLLIFIAFGIYFIRLHNNPHRTAGNNGLVKILPGGNKAVLTLANGSHIVLNDVKNGVLAYEQSAEVNKTADGKLIYEASGAHSQIGTPQFNTISTPRGGQYQIILADGTKVWLNAASSLKFPTAFNGTERRIELLGEAYFEVAKDKNKPFLVIAKDMTIEVLGTHFNVLAYDEEPIWKTTLVEGKVMISQGNSSSLLAPGYQASIKDNRISTEKVDTGEAIAWKNGYFSFNRSDLRTIMRQISRWYDVEVVYAGRIPDDEFVGEIPRSASIQEVLKILKLSHLKFKMEDRKLIVLNN